MRRGEEIGTGTHRERHVITVIERMEWYRFKAGDVKSGWTIAEDKNEKKVLPHCLQID